MWGEEGGGGLGAVEAAVLVLERPVAAGRSAVVAVRACLLPTKRHGALLRRGVGARRG